jgi:hypothetical protein
VTRKSTVPIPEPLAQLQRQRDQFRSTNPPRTKLPEPIWAAATGLAKEFGLCPTASVLRLDYTGLKNRLMGSAPPRRKPAKAAFVELLAPHPPAAPAECVIEFESAQGATMRIRWKASTSPDWSSLLRAWRETQG